MVSSKPRKSFILSRIEKSVLNQKLSEVHIRPIRVVTRKAAIKGIEERLNAARKGLAVADTILRHSGEDKAVINLRNQERANVATLESMLSMLKRGVTKDEARTLKQSRK